MARNKQKGHFVTANDLSNDIAISVQGVSKSFILPHDKQSSIKGGLINLFNGDRSYEVQEVLRDVSFNIKKGEFFGIVGRNGSGKSTLLKMIAGIYTPTKGKIVVNGSLTPFIELGVGFNPELTGRENVFLNGALLGFNRSEMDAMYDDIVEFAELERFMDQKLKNYSSGMQVRLAFSIAIRAKSDILLLDEVLAVGDAIFQKKCFDYFKLLKKEKKTVVFVSHDIGALQEYCDKGVLIESGELVTSSDISNVTNNYIEIISNQENKKRKISKKPSRVNRVGVGEIIFKDITLTDDLNQRRQTFTNSQKSINIIVEYEFMKDSDAPIYGVTIFDAAGIRIFGSNTMWEKKKVGAVKKGKKIKVTWEVPNILKSGTYTITPAVAEKMGTVMQDQVDNICEFQVRKINPTDGIISIDHEIEITMNYE